MRVLLVAGLDIALPGGLETHIRELATGLERLGHEVDILGGASRPVAARVVERPAARGYDVIHHHAGGLGAARGGAGCLVHTLHFCVAAKMAVYVRIGRLRTLANLANWRAVGDERAWARGPARMIAVSGRVRDEFARWHGLDPARATVISNGFVSEAPAEDGAALRRRHAIAADAFLLLTIGRDDFVKGYGVLGRAWARSEAAARGAVWVTVGGAHPERGPGRIVTGPVPHGEVASWIAAADAGALPSYYEGCSVALLEMAGGGLFTLAHAVGNAEDLIRPGTGELLERSVTAWSDALGRLIEGRPPRSRVSLAEAYGWPAIVATTERVYREAIAAG